MYEEYSKAPIISSILNFSVIMSQYVYLPAYVSSFSNTQLIGGGGDSGTRK